MGERKKSEEVTVVRQYRLQGGKNLEEHPETDPATMPVHSFVTEPASVFVELGMTVNLGRFESAKVTVGLRVPCYKEEVEAAYIHAREWVEARVLSEAEEARKFAKTREPLDM